MVCDRYRIVVNETSMAAEAVCVGNAPYIL